MSRVPWTSFSHHSPAQSHPSGAWQSTKLRSLYYTAGSHYQYFTHSSGYMSVSISQLVPFSPSPRASTSVPCVSNSIPALQIGSSVPFFKTLHTRVNIQYLFFSVWFTSLCMTDSRSIHISTDGSISFFLWLSNIPEYTHQLWWEYLHHVNWQVLQTRTLFFPPMRQSAVNIYLSTTVREAAKHVTCTQKYLYFKVVSI